MIPESLPTGMAGGPREYNSRDAKIPGESHATHS